MEFKSSTKNKDNDIKLVYCLQYDQTWSKDGWESCLKVAIEVVLFDKDYIRYEGENYDVILVDTGVSRAVFLGHWNGGTR